MVSYNHIETQQITTLLTQRKGNIMAGFTDWMKENATIAFIPVISFAACVVDAEPLAFILALAGIFIVSLLVICCIRLFMLALGQ